MPSKLFVYDYYDITVAGAADDNVGTLGRRAILEADRRTISLAGPYCQWRAHRIKGAPGEPEVTFRVRRKRRRPTWGDRNIP